MIPLFRLLAAQGAAASFKGSLRAVSHALLACSLFAACATEEEREAKAFAVRFSLASVPGNLTLDSLEAEISLGDAGEPRALTVDLKSGSSKTQVLAYPGQKYRLAYRLYASGFAIGAGGAEGTLSEDMAIDLHPTWDPARIESARAARRTGKLLPAYLDSSFGKALAGKELGIRLDSAAGHVYTWYVRVGNATVAAGEGTRVDYAPPDSLGGSTLNLKLVVKREGKVIEERDWDIQVLSGLPGGLPFGVVTQSDTSSSSGTFTRYRYNAEGRPDSILYYDTTAWVPGRDPIATLAITYTRAHRPSGDPSHVVRTAVNEPDLDSLFSYDATGRLVALTVNHPAGATADSLAYPSDSITTIASFGQGRLTRMVKRVRESRDAMVDSIWSPGDTGLELSGRIVYGMDAGQVVNLRVFRKFGPGLVAYRSEWTLYNALGSPAFRHHYEEGSTLILERTETFEYRSDGRLGRILRRDEVTGEIERAERFVYDGDQAVAKTASPQSTASRSGIPVSIAGSGIPILLSEVDRYFPSTRNIR